MEGRNVYIIMRDDCLQVPCSMLLSSIIKNLQPDCLFPGPDSFMDRRGDLVE